MKTQESIHKLYDQDYASWIEVTLNQLRSHDLKNIDWENLIEEIEDLGREQRNKVESFLRQLLKHLLLYQYWESEKNRCRNGWIEEIDNFRAELEILLRSKTLSNYLDSILESTYYKAKRSATLKSNLKDLPESCPYSLKEILDPEWFP
jgi:Domain of unknown function DUF29